ncbi:hypothetical protein [Actinoplanes sp. NPDC051859]|uniref:hypothetical protein n=1 Tax=Actinoplanes sp. NPDC051859 TaxID=3363909 RepID=UPI0037A90209
MSPGDDVTTAGGFVPAPRAPHPIELADLPPLALVPGAAPLPLPPAPPRRRSKLVLFGVLALAAAVGVGAGAAYVAQTEPLETVAVAAPPKPTLTPFEQANLALKEHAAALLRGDEAGWLAPVDPRQPKLRARYRTMFRSLRALGVEHFAYRTTIHNSKSDSLGIFADVEHCFTGENCERSTDSAGPPTSAQTLKFKIVSGRWLITSVNTTRRDQDRQPAPWENNEIVTVHGQRVTLAGIPAEQKNLQRLLPIAERAATVNDRYASLVGNPQQRYRIYLAGPKHWKSWYGGITDEWVVGYALPRNQAGSDVVLNLAKLENDDELLATTVQHELAHVVTVGRVRHSARSRNDMWLKEGIAEYIAWHPRPATASWRSSAVSSAVHSSRPPTTIAAAALGDNADNDDGDTFYGLSHYAADCLATKYGERALFTFVRLYLREDRDLDPAAQEAFGKPFAAVDQTCMNWIRDRA